MIAALLEGWEEVWVNARTSRKLLLYTTSVVYYLRCVDDHDGLLR